MAEQQQLRIEVRGTDIEIRQTDSDYTDLMAVVGAACGIPLRWLKDALVEADDQTDCALNEVTVAGDDDDTATIDELIRSCSAWLSSDALAKLRAHVTGCGDDTGPFVLCESSTARMGTRRILLLASAHRRRSARDNTAKIRIQADVLSFCNSVGAAPVLCNLDAYFRDSPSSRPFRAILSNICRRYIEGGNIGGVFSLRVTL